MKKCLLIVVLHLYIVLSAPAQSVNKAEQRIRDFHAAIVLNNTDLSDYLHDSLSYGHSNGWIQDRVAFLNDMGKKIIYHKFSEDSLQVVESRHVLYARFQAKVEATLNGSRKAFDLNVLEVWVRQAGNWLLLVRQAIKQ